jgi:hypothetical protein
MNNLRKSRTETAEVLGRFRPARELPLNHLRLRACLHLFYPEWWCLMIIQVNGDLDVSRQLRENRNK